MALWSDPKPTRMVASSPSRKYSLRSREIGLSPGAPAMIECRPATLIQILNPTELVPSVITFY